MRLITLKKDTALSALALGCGTSEKELMTANDIEALSLLPCGMSLLLPSKERPEKQRLELFVSDTGHGPNTPVSAVVYAASMFQPENLIPPYPYSEKAPVLSVLGISNTDETGFLSAPRSHTVLADENAAQNLSEQLLVRLEQENRGGLLISMEYLFPFDRVPFTSFVRRIEKAVHSSGRWLMVAVPSAAILSPHSRCGSAYDIAALSEFSDRLLIMPEDALTPDIIEKCLYGLAGLMPVGKALLGLKPHAIIHRGNEDSRISPIAAHNLAISARARISREGKGYPARFYFSDAAGLPCSVSYTDGLWFHETVLQALDSGFAGIFLCTDRELFPGASMIFQHFFSAETLI